MNASQQYLVNEKKLSGSDPSVTFHAGFNPNVICVCFPKSIRRVLINEDREEITKQLTELRNQYDELLRLKESADTISKKDLNEVRSELAMKEGLYTALQQELKKLINTTAEADDEIVSALRIKMQEAEQSITKLTREKEELQQQFAKDQAELGNLGQRAARVVELEKQLATVQQELEEVNKAKTQLQSEYDLLSQDNQRKIQELKALTQKSQDASEQSSKDEQRIKELQAQIEQNQKDKAEIAATQAKELDTLKKELQEAQTQIQTEMQKYTTLLNETSAASVKQKEALEAKVRDNEAYEKQLEALRQSIKEAENKLQNLIKKSGSSDEKVAEAALEAYAKIEKCKTLGKGLYQCLLENNTELADQVPANPTPLKDVDIQLMLRDVGEGESTSSSSSTSSTSTVVQQISDCVNQGNDLNSCKLKNTPIPVEFKDGKYLILQEGDDKGKECIGDKYEYLSRKSGNRSKGCYQIANDWGTRGYQPKITRTSGK